MTAYLAERGLDVSGVDLSAPMIDHARRLHPDQRFAVASATDLNLVDSSLGGILGWWSLFNLPRHILDLVLKSFARAPDGNKSEMVLDFTPEIGRFKLVNGKAELLKEITLNGPKSLGGVKYSGRPPHDTSEVVDDVAATNANGGTPVPDANGYELGRQGAAGHGRRPTAARS